MPSTTLPVPSVIIWKVNSFHVLCCRYVCFVSTPIIWLWLVNPMMKTNKIFWLLTFVEKSGCMFLFYFILITKKLVISTTLQALFLQHRHIFCIHFVYSAQTEQNHFLLKKTGVNAACAKKALQRPNLQSVLSD